MASDPTTLLVIAAFGVPPYSARGLTQTLQPIDAATSLRRTVNGELLDLSEAEFRKYSSEITCRDQQSPALDGVWPGASVVVDCVVELAYLTDGPTDLTDTDETEERALAGRTIVEGSWREENGFAFYRPRLTMRVVSFSIDRDEYGAEIGWTLRLEEI